MSIEVFDDRVCLLGEGPLWHPVLQQLFWFDIMGKRLLTRDADGEREWQFDRYVSAAGWIDADRLLIASDRDLFLFELATGLETHIAGLESDNPVTRSNDGRADPRGGFWIGTMGLNAEPGAGSLFRYFRGEVRCLRDGVTIPNAICFSPDGHHAYFADTAEHIVWRYSLDADGWPDGEPQVFLDHRTSRLNPDGAVIDADGRFWCAEWGESRVACYGPDGAFLSAVKLPAPQPTCPAFGGSYLYVTTARQGLPDGAIECAPHSGKTLRIAVEARGQAEHRVIT
jgi:sugar lactone lactonase YvrE